MWAYNNQIESGRGCWRQDVCTGTGAFDVFDGRKIQWFCSEEQFAENKDRTLPWKTAKIIDPAPFDEFEEACEQDEDCPHPELG